MLEKLYSRRRFGIRPGLDRIRVLLDRLGNPEQAFSSVHVVGTNGKGSTSAFLSSILIAGGYRTALFTSPHLINFSERFRINGSEPENEKLARLLETVISIAPEEATFFEIVTALAALHFAENSVEIAVMEAGMGGRFDSTAALPGLLTLISPVALDHCDYLGDSIEAIAIEKASIAETGTAVVTSMQPPQALQAIREICRSKGLPLTVAGTDFYATWDSLGRLDYNGMGITLSGLVPGIPGRYQSGNAALALAAAEKLAELGFNSSPDSMKTGIAAACWPGRMEVIPGEKRLMLDGAHNPAGAAALADALEFCDYDRLYLVTGVMADKNAREIIRPLAKMVYKAFCVTPAIERAMGDAELADITRSLGIDSLSCGTVANGIAMASADAAENDLILICGSLFTVGEAKAVLGGIKFEGIRG
jgi:dihydrofolate synthase / folylpolyglutamate synthase